MGKKINIYEFYHFTKDVCFPKKEKKKNSLLFSSS